MRIVYSVPMENAIIRKDTALKLLKWFLAISSAAAFC